MKLLIDLPAFDEGMQLLRGLSGIEPVCIQPPGESARALPAETIRDAEVLFCAYPPTNLQDMRMLKWIQIASSGYDQLLGLELPGRGIRATNCRGCLDVPIAEWSMAMMINLVRNVPQMLRNQ